MKLAQTIQTSRLNLQLLTAADLPTLFTLWSDPQVTHFMNISPMQSIAEVRQMVDMFAQARVGDSAIRYGIWRQQQLIGTCGYNEINWQLQRAEIGYELQATAWGQGLGSELVGALVRDAFEHLALQRLEAYVLPDNIASGLVLQHNHFQKEGRLRHYEQTDNGFSDIDLYSCIDGIDIGGKKSDHD
ncbi:GNAT family N-acetyltransferase [Loigolactobacillus jiayinensis]|uniref:GNAT family N-acetyltransferase n=1 Tax=Loigolactobacillus jiayinensis TaxID=2486016 RepID=A0ABW1RDW4_9LACO|nr:GNAT family N-acetyltransferase [Loigolactobacillus jiayinensis]